jgi:hypothetical protein
MYKSLLAYAKAVHIQHQDLSSTHLQVIIGVGWHGAHIERDEGQRVQAQADVAAHQQQPCRPQVVAQLNGLAGKVRGSLGLACSRQISVDWRCI